MNVLRRFGLVALASVLAVATAACSDSRQRNAANVGGTWACDNGQIGLLYQVTKNNGVSNIYTYVKEGENQWGNNLVAKVDGVASGSVLNALTLTPQGVMYAVLSPDGGSSNSSDIQLVRIEPPTGDNETTFTVIKDLPSEANPKKSVNSGTYIEINGVPHLAMANNSGRANSYLYNLNTGDDEQNFRHS